MIGKNTFTIVEVSWIMPSLDHTFSISLEHCGTHCSIERHPCTNFINCKSFVNHSSLAQAKKC